MGIDEVRAALNRIDNDNPLADFEMPVRGLDERAIPLGSLSQESYSSGMNVDSPAGSQAGVSAYSVPIQFPPSQPSLQSSEGCDEGLGSLSREINKLHSSPMDKSRTRATKLPGKFVVVGNV
ncbi:unnamed protein product [Allacma fusca]|uniref:Uncharacterized protein n=1 Tax=Allacma fusca TaxID=39272 RepID=A0A8J2NY65_9HEXA|nr:unnamed protein product [Allacma fusca]